MGRDSDGSRAQSQADRFIETARTLGCGEDGAVFKAKFVAAAPDGQQANGSKDVRVTTLPARRAKGAFSASDWSASRVGMRDKAQRVGGTKRKATKSITKPVAPGTKR